MIPEAMRNVILEHFAGLDIWQAWWEQSAIVLVGSSVLGVAGIITVVPPLEPAVFVYGVGLIVWWVWLGIVMLRGNPSVTAQQPDAFVPRHSRL